MRISLDLVSDRDTNESSVKISPLDLRSRSVGRSIDAATRARHQEVINVSDEITVLQGAMLLAAIPKAPAAKRNSNRARVAQSGHIRPLFPNARLPETGSRINHYRICLQ